MARRRSPDIESFRSAPWHNNAFQSSLVNLLQLDGSGSDTSSSQATPRHSFNISRPAPAPPVEYTIYHNDGRVSNFTGPPGLENVDTVQPTFSEYLMRRAAAAHEYASSESSTSSSVGGENGSLYDLYMRTPERSSRASNGTSEDATPPRSFIPPSLSRALDRTRAWRASLSPDGRPSEDQSHTHDAQPVERTPRSSTSSVTEQLSPGRQTPLASPTRTADADNSWIRPLPLDEYGFVQEEESPRRPRPLSYFSLGLMLDSIDEEDEESELGSHDTDISQVDVYFVVDEEASESHHSGTPSDRGRSAAPSPSPVRVRFDLAPREFDLLPRQPTKNIRRKPVPPLDPELEAHISSSTEAGHRPLVVRVSQADLRRLNSDVELRKKISRTALRVPLSAIPADPTSPHASVRTRSLRIKIPSFEDINHYATNGFAPPIPVSENEVALDTPVVPLRRKARFMKVTGFIQRFRRVSGGDASSPETAPSTIETLAQRVRQSLDLGRPSSSNNTSRVPSLSSLSTAETLETVPEFLAGFPTPGDYRPQDAGPADDWVEVDRPSVQDLPVQYQRPRPRRLSRVFGPNPWR